MNSFNKVILLGNLVHDPELRYLPDGTPKVAVALALNETWKDAAGEKRERVDYIDVTVFRGLAETLARYKKKGDPVVVEGRLRQERWDDKDTGKKRSRVGVVASNVIFLPRGTADGARQTPDSDVPHNVGQVFPNAEPVPDEEIPF